MLGGNSRKSRSANARVDTLIGHETAMTGDIRFNGGLHIDGIVRGNVTAEDESDSVVIISEQGRIEGELRVPHILVNGRVTGDVYAAERVDLAANARVEGDVYYRTIEMAGGAEINGKLVRTDQPPQRFLEHHGTGADVAATAPESATGPAADEDGDAGREQHSATTA